MGVTLCDDGIFRGFFGRPESEFLLMNLINAVFRNAKESEVKSIEIQNPFNFNEFLGDKESILDVKARDEQNRLYDIEVQMASHVYFHERVLYYWAKNYSSQLRKGNSYDFLRPAISIIFVKFPFDANKELLFDTYQIVSKYDNQRHFTDHLNIHFIRIPDRLNQNVCSEFDFSLVSWLKMLNYPDKTSEAEMTKIIERNPVIEAAMEQAQEFFARPDVRDYIEAREKRLRDQEAIQQTFFYRGKNEGKLEGKIDDIKEILQEKFSNLPIDLVIQLSKISDYEEAKQLFKIALSVLSLDAFIKKMDEIHKTAQMVDDLS